MRLFNFASVLICCLCFNSAASYKSEELQCLVCKSSLEELNKAINKIDPSKQVDVGGYQLDSEGNYRKKTVSQAKSEVHLSDVIEEICTKMDDYVRATWKSNGELTLLKLITDSGQMNSAMSEVDLIQDDDLNKSLKYLCEGMMEEHEEIIIKNIQNDSENLERDVCVVGTGLCAATVPGPPSVPKPDVSVNTEL